MATQPSPQHQLISHFLSLIAHELRSPLNAINGYLDLTLEGMAGELNEQQREFIRRARASSEHLYALLEDILLIWRADSGQLRLKRAPHSLALVVDAAMEELELSAQDAGVHIEASLPAALPDLWIDAVRVQHILRNLLSNALHSTSAGGHVLITARPVPLPQEQGQHMLEIRVRDNGCGIRQEHLEQVFERFFQVPRPEGGRNSGQGLGLAVVKEIVQLHGGQVRIESAPESGCTVTLTLDALRQPT
ncbi:MAG TPA: HAMP domain-containing sensor histidine kinase [Ktedonobacteraceae bacterium]|jgi:signal transduction histidine kinase